MKLYLFIFLFFTIATGLNAQQLKEISHYLFPEFKNGVVLMKSGTENPAQLNYNSATEEMVFMQGEQVLALAEITLSQLDTVFIEGRKFVLQNNKFAEVIHDNDYTLLIEHKCRVLAPGKPSGYGGTSQTSAISSYSSLSMGGQMYELELPDDFTVKPYFIYWLNDGSGWKEFRTISSLRRFYRKDRKEYNNYAKENNVDFDNPESITKLIEHIVTATP